RGEPMGRSKNKREVGRRDFLKIGGASAAALAVSGSGSGEAEPLATSSYPEPGAAGFAPETKYPKLAIITPYSPQKLAFATAAGYEGVVVPLDNFFDPDRLTDTQIDSIMSTSHSTGARIISIECMWGLNHIDPEPAQRVNVHARFIRCIEFAHRL